MKSLVAHDVRGHLPRSVERIAIRRVTAPSLLSLSREKTSFSRVHLSKMIFSGQNWDTSCLRRKYNII